MSRIFIAVLALLAHPVFASDPDNDAPSPLTPEQAASSMVVPDGFKVTLFAGEPDVQQPIGFCIDDRGRLWVAEAYNYPNHGTKPGDRIVILEDTDGDGRFDKRKIFYDQLNYVTGIEVGFGGAWVMSPPYFYFIPDRNGDDVPDSQPELLLDGFGNHANSHNLANGFAWGPDGWLYGTHGRTNWSRIAKPGTPEEKRVQFDGGVYRYHPVKHVWEPFADGTTNPWGIDWNDVGDSFVTNCVNPHLFQVIQGAHYEPWRNRESSKYAYERIATIADHFHFLGGQDFHKGIGSQEEDLLGGGHAHCGTMIYLGDNWPEKYRNSIFTNNIHGKRINNDLLSRSGSGYTASHGKDILRSRDPWHMGVTLQYGPDGGVYMSDWSDVGECHSIRNTRRETGRIFKITFGNSNAKPIDIARLSDNELIALHLHRNEWQVRHARRILQERAANGNEMSNNWRQLKELFQQQKDIPNQLRALWTLRVIGGTDEGFLVDLLSHSSENIRAWAIRFLCEDSSASQIALKCFQDMALNDNSAYVRLHLASGLQRLAVSDRWGIAGNLLSHAEDSSDMNLPLMIWYAIEPLVETDFDRFVTLAKESKIPLVRKHIARRVASHAKASIGLNALSRMLVETVDPLIQLDLLDGILQAMEGRRIVDKPDAWNQAFAKLETSPNRRVRGLAVESALLFGDARAFETQRRIATDRSEDPSERNRALHSLVMKKANGVDALLIDFLSDKPVRREAIRGLAEFNHPATEHSLVSRFADFDSEERQDALQSLASKVKWAAVLLDAVESKQIPRTEVTAFTARQIQNLGDAQLSQRIATQWGEVRTTSDEKKGLIAKYRKQLTTENLKKANLVEGRLQFQKQCAKCHRLFGEGGAIGPDITGAQRSNVDYMLENLVDPSAAVSRDFQMELVLTEAGRVITGLVVDETDVALTIQTPNDRLIVPKTEISERTLSKVSMMPDGVLQTLTPEQVRDLIGYLASPKQVQLPR